MAPHRALLSSCDCSSYLQGFISVLQAGEDKVQRGHLLSQQTDLICSHPLSIPYGDCAWQEQKPGKGNPVECDPATPPAPWLADSPINHRRRQWAQQVDNQYFFTLWFLTSRAELNSLYPWNKCIYWNSTTNVLLEIPEAATRGSTRKHVRHLQNSLSLKFKP